MELIFKFKKEIFGLFFAGIIILIIVYLLVPDRSEQVFDTLTFLAVLLIIIPVLIIALRYLMEQRN